MKKLFLVVLLFLIGKIGYSQYPNSFGVSNSNTQYYVKGGFGADSSFVFRTAFADTTAANRGWLDGIPGCFIRTTGGFLWVRNDAATAWIYVGGGAGTGTNIYNSNGSLTGDRVLSGTNLYNLRFDAVTSFRAEANASTGKVSSMNISPDSVLFQPNEGIFIIDSLASGASTDSVLVWTQATGRVKKRSYSAFTPTWQQTLTAGSTLNVDNSVNAGAKTFSMTNLLGYYLESTNGRSIVFDEESGQPDEISIFQSVTGFNNSLIQLTNGSINIRNLWNERENEMFIRSDSIYFKPSFGNINIDTLRSGTMTNRLMGWTQGTVDNGKVGYLTLGSGLSLSSGVLNTSGTVPTPISSLTASTGTNSITVGHPQTWNYNGIQSTTGHTFTSNSITSGTIMDITGISSFLAAGNEGLNIAISGANATNGITATGARISVTNTNATSGTNNALDLTASGATTANNAINIAAGAIALNGSAGTTGQFLTSAGASGLPTWTTPTVTSPAGNFGNLQINRNSAFATPASDSLDWESSTGLSIIGRVNINDVNSGEANGANGLRIIATTAGLGAGVQMGNSTTGSTNVWQFFSKGATLDFAIGRANVQDNILMGGTSGAPKTYFPGPNGGATMPAGNFTILADAGTNAAFVPIIAKLNASQTADAFQVQNSAGTALTVINSSGSVGIGTTSPTAVLHLKAGTATASTAPLKFTAGTNLTATEAGAMEWDGTNLFITQTTGPTRKTLAYTTDGLTVGTTTITSGTNTRILYNNSGVLGEYAVTGTGTTAVLSTSPTFTTDITTPLIYGGTALGGNLTISSTSNATKGKIFFTGSDDNIVAVFSGTTKGVRFSAASTTSTLEGVDNTGTGSYERLSIGGSELYFNSNGSTNRWQLNSSGHFLAATDNTYDIGASGATRPRTGYFGTSVITPLLSTNALNLDRTITAAGTTGNQTINKMAGTVNIAAAGTTVTVTNSLVTTSSIIFCTLRTDDATATIKNVVASAGSFVITLTAAATAEVSIGFLVTN